ARPLRPGQRLALLERECEPPAHGKHTGDRLQQRLLVAEGEHRLEQQHDLEPARRKRRHLPDLEAAGEAAGAFCSDRDGARARVHAEVDAAELARDEPTGSGDAATQVENGDARTDVRLLRERQDLGRADEALLLGVLARAERQPLGSPQGVDGRAALVLAHGPSANRCIPAHRSAKRMLARGANLRAGRSPLAALGSQSGPLAGLGGTLLLLVVLGRAGALGRAGWIVGLASGLTLNVALARALRRDRSARLGPA